MRPFVRSQVEGRSAEARFTRIGRGYGWRVEEASKHDDMRRHIDVYIAREERRLSVDIKARKRVRRGDDNACDEWWWLERTNVQGRRGWLHGEADVIAFETPRGFELLERDKLAAWADTAVDWERRVSSPGLAHYRCYTRFGRRDEVTLVKAGECLRAALLETWVEPRPPSCSPPKEAPTETHGRAG